MIKAKNGNLIFANMKELNSVINKHFKPQIEMEIGKYQKKCEEAIKQAKTDAVKEALTLVLPIACNAVYEAYSVDEGRMREFIHYFQVHMSCLGDGVTTIADYKQWCKDQGYEYQEIVVEV